MVIIWGTRYYFSRDKKTFMGMCAKCKREVRLKSYTASKFSHLYFIPLIPHGKHRILAECPKCQWVEYVDYKVWAESRDKELSAMQARLQEHPDDPTVILEGLVLCMKYLERDIYDKLAEGALLGFSDHAQVMEATWVAAGRFGDKKSAKRALEACVALGGTPLVQLAWAEMLMQDNRLDEMQDFALKAIAGNAEGMEKTVPDFAKAQLAAGNPDQAAELMSELLKVAPAATSERAVRKTVAKINKALPTDRPVVMLVGSWTRMGDFARSAALWGGVSLAAAAVMYTVLCYTLGQFRTVHVLNGTDAVATIAVDGDKQLELPARSHATLTVSEGQHTINATYADGKQHNKTIRVNTDFFSRPFASYPTYVLNPDRLALIKRVNYGPDPKAGPVETLSLINRWKVYEGIDAAFPETLPHPERNQRVLTLYVPEGDLAAVIDDLEQRESDVLVREYLSRFAGHYGSNAQVEALQEKYRPRAVFPFLVLNGLEREYTVQLADQRVTLPPLGHKQVRVQEQPLTLSSPDGSLAIDEMTIFVPDDFWRNGHHQTTVHIINPDRQAFFATSETIYGDIGRQPVVATYGGELFVALHRVEHVFEEPPESLYAAGVRTQLMRLSREQYTSYLASLIATEPETVKKEIYRRLGQLPEDEWALAMLSVTADPEEYRAYLEEQVEKRPVIVNAHRMYQNLMEIRDPEHDLLAQYTRYLKADPDNPDLQYLLARVTPERNARFALYDKACTSDKSCMRAFTAVAFECLGAGEFENGYYALQPCLTGGTDDWSVLNMRDALLQGMGRYDELLEMNNRLRETDPLNFNLVNRRVELLVAKGETEKAKTVIGNYLLELGKDNGELVPSAKNHLDIALLRYQGKLADAAAKLQGDKTPDNQFLTALYAGKYADAFALVSAGEISGLNYCLPIHIAAKGKDDDTAAKALSAAVEALAQGNFEERRAALWLSGKATPTIGDIRDLPLEHEAKLLVATALGLEMPELKADCFVLAKKLNFSLDFPHWIIEQRIKQETTTASSR